MAVAKAKKAKAKAVAEEPAAQMEQQAAEQAADGQQEAKKSKKSKKSKAEAAGEGAKAPTASSSSAPAGTMGSIASKLTGAASLDPNVSSLFTVTKATVVAPAVPLILPGKTTEGEESEPKGKKDGKGKKRKAETAEEDGEKAEGDDAVEPEAKKPKREVDPDRAKRTLFVGNVPLKIKRDAFKRVFKPFGKIESVRFRSVAMADPHVSKQVGFATKKFHEQRTSMNAYVVFAEESAAKAALAANGTVVEGHHLICDIAASSAQGDHDTKHTVFVGGLPFEVETEAVWEHFSQCGEVDNVRVVRDKQTNYGKGIAYVRFKDVASVGLAERLNGTEVGGKKIRVSRALDKKTLERKAQKKTGKKSSFQGTTTKASGAARRIAAAKLSKPKKDGKRPHASKAKKPPTKASKAKLQKKVESKKKKLASKKA